MVQVQIQLLSHNATAPKRGSTGAAGYDLFAAASGVIPAHGRALVATDLTFVIPPDHYGRVAPRSGLAVRFGIDVGAGVIDSDYRGHVSVLLFNTGDAPFAYQLGDRIAQIVFERISTPDIEVVDALPDVTARGAGGFGSTGGFSAAVPPEAAAEMGPLA